MGNLTTYQSVLELWRTRAALARLIGAKEALVRSWHARDSIPEKYFLRIVDAASRCGFDGVTYPVLTSIQAGAALRSDEPI
jgi:hypothetical protein